MSSNDHNYVMSPVTAEAVGGLLNVCGDTTEVQPTQLAICGHCQGVSSAASTKREARQDQVTTMCCENRTWKKGEIKEKKGDNTCVHFLLCVLISCIYVPMLCLLAYCFNSVVWVYDCYRTCQRRVSRLLLYYGAQTERCRC